MFNNKNFYLNKEILLIFLLYLSLLVSFIYGENSTGGAILDYNSQKTISSAFASNFKETFFNYDDLPTRHSPILIIFLSSFKKLNFNDDIIRIIHLHLCLFLPLFFFKILQLKYENTNTKILLLLTGLIFLSPTFRTLAIWPDSRILGLTFFSLSIYFFLQFKKKLNFKFVILNIITCAISAYISPNFSVFSLYYLFSYILIYKLISKKIFIILFLNLILALPAIYYIFILDIFFLNKSATINFENNNIFYYNIFNDILITFSIIFFYIFPFMVGKFINYLKHYELKILILSFLLFFLCVYNFDYNYSYSGGGIFFKISNFIFGNNILFYSISLISIIILFPMFIKNKMNLFILFLILINNPQYTMYHKYFDPFLLILFFSLFSFTNSLEDKSHKNFIFLYSYFFMFLVISNLKFIWTI